MSITFNKESLYDGIDFFSIVDKRFKTNLISIWLIDRLSEENAPCNALSMSFVSKSNKKYPDMTLLNKKLSSLYGANLSGTTSKVGDNQFMMLGISCIADKYALGSENLKLESTDILMDCLLEPNIENGGFSEKLFTPIKQELLDDIDAIKEIITERISAIDVDELEKTLDHIDSIIDKWEIQEPGKYQDFTAGEVLPLMFPAGSMRNANWGKRGFPTPTSMRNVDASCEAIVLESGYFEEDE